MGWTIYYHKGKIEPGIAENFISLEMGCLMIKTKGGALVSQIYQISSRIWNRILRENEMSDMEGARGCVIFALWSQNGVPIKTLCEKTSLDKSTLTGIFARLERDGLLKEKKMKMTNEIRVFF